MKREPIDFNFTNIFDKVEADVPRDKDFAL